MAVFLISVLHFKMTNSFFTESGLWAALRLAVTEACIASRAVWRRFCRSSTIQVSTGLWESSWERRRWLWARFVTKTISSSGTLILRYPHVAVALTVRAFWRTSLVNPHAPSPRTFNATCLRRRMIQNRKLFYAASLKASKERIGHFKQESNRTMLLCVCNVPQPPKFVRFAIHRAKRLGLS